jgi:TatD DNase family protein
MFDTHAHLNFTNFSKDLEQILAKCEKHGISVINVGTNYLTSKKAVEIAEKHERVFAAIGLHALNISHSEIGTKVCEHSVAPIFEKPEDFLECEFDYELYKNLAKSKLVVAVGEVGLDYYYKPKTNIKLEAFKIKQLEILKKQVRLAQELDLPVIYHVRMAHNDLIAYLEEEIKAGRKISGVIHCFTGTLEQAKKYLDFGLYIGLNGIIFKMDMDKTIAQFPKDRIIFETDCPYLTPPAVSGRNEPANVKYVVERVAEIRNETIGAVEQYSNENAKKLFGAG